MDIIRTGIVDPATDVFWGDRQTQGIGSVQKPVLIVVSAYEQGSEDEVQLQKMLGACGLKQEQYNIIQLNKEEKTPWHGLREQLDPKVVFLIGVMPSQLGISALFEAHVPNNFNDRVWLPTLSISELEQQQAVKKQLWVNGMKPIFVDKTIGNIEA
jgi:hypothetical protein